MSSRLEGLARNIAVGFWILTSLFAWLVSVPFANENFVRPRLLPGLMEFAELHAVLALLLLPIAWAALRSTLAHPRATGVARTVLGLWVASGVLLLLAPSLAALPSDNRALAVAVAALVLPLGFAIADLRRAAPFEESRPVDRTWQDAAAVVATAGFVFTLYSLLASARGEVSGAGLLASALTHLLAAAVLLIGLTAVRAWSALRERPVYAEFWLGTLLLAVSLSQVMTGWVLPSLSASGSARWAAAIGIATTLAFTLAARGRVIGARRRDGIVVAFTALVPEALDTLSPAAWIAWLLTLTLIAWAGTAASRLMDWNFLLLTLSVLLVWILALGTALAGVRAVAAARRLEQWPTPAVLGACVFALAAYLVAVPAPTQAGSPSSVDTWAVSDPSFRTIRDALRPAAPADEGFYEFLQQHTNLGPDVQIRPFPIRHAELEGGPAPDRPHVFLFVVDSLRRDYLAPYNQAVRFTPRIAEFAAESVVFERAFTRYGATGLSVPSIWVGGLVPHKQYPQPFGPFNSLHALLAHEQYETWLSWDNVVDAVVPREGTGPPLSADRAVKDFRFCDMIGDVRSRLDRLKPGGSPVFAWGLPQDIHISAITREGNTALGDRPYDGFHAPYASRIERIDGCFGEFIDDLKARSLYDSSIVILTSDHGDSLGEEGRWGHAYTIFPEVLQIPLLVHLPAALRERFAVDTSAAAFTADLTPTIYELLGHETTQPGPMFGQPLVWAKGTARPARAGRGALVASSYGSVYGWLSQDARELYLSDGVSLRDYRYALDGSPTGRALPVDEADRRLGQEAIRQALTDLARFYKLD